MTRDIPEEVVAQLLMCHGTTQEFLAHFWTAFLSGDSSKANVVAKMVESLKKTRDRVDSIISAGGGQSTKIEQSMAPTLIAVAKALGEYKRALQQKI